MRLRVLVLLGVLVLAGCTGTSGHPPAGSTNADRVADAATPGTVETGATASAPPAMGVATTITPETGPAKASTGGAGSTSTTPSASPTSSPAGRTTPAPPSTRPPVNPWGKAVVTVGIDNVAGNANHEYATFRRALWYWTNNSSRYAGYDVAFDLQPHNQFADVLLRYVDSIDRCGTVDHHGSTVLGCAPLGPRRPQTVIRLRATDDDRQLRRTTEHELGHVLGIQHGQPPMPLMAATTLYARAVPWNASHLTYFVDYADKPGLSTTYLDDQIEPGISYFERGAGGRLADPPTLERVHDRSAANVVIEVHAGYREGTTTGGSTRAVLDGSVQGTHYRRVTIALYHLDSDSYDWHVAYWLAPMVLDDPAAVPSVLSGDPDACSFACRHGDWWDE